MYWYSPVIFKSVGPYQSAQIYHISKGVLKHFFERSGSINPNPRVSASRDHRWECRRIIRQVIHDRSWCIRQLRGFVCHFFGQTWEVGVTCQFNRNLNFAPRMLFEFSDFITLYFQGIFRRYLLQSSFPQPFLVVKKKYVKN